MLCMWHTLASLGPWSARATSPKTSICVDKMYEYNNSDGGGRDDRDSGANDVIKGMTVLMET